MAAENFKVKKGLEVGTGITATSSGIDVTGIVTATTFSGAFSGDGSAITGVTASGSGVIVRHDGSNVGTAGTIDFSTNLDVSAVSAGIVTITATGGSTGISTVSGVVSIANDLDVDGHTELDNLNVAGVSTFTDDVHFHGYSGITSIIYDKSASELRFKDNVRLKFGDSQDLHIYHSGGNSIIREQGVGDLVLTGQNILIQNVTNGATMGHFVAGGAVKLHHNSQQKFITTNEGVLVSGGTTTGTLSVSGLSTFTGNIDANANLDVDGETNLDDVVVAGVSTFNDGITLGTNSTTFAAKFADEAVANFGTDHDLQISHDNSNALIRNSTGKIIVVGVVSATSGAVVTGVVSATTFSGAGTSLTNIPSGQLVGALPALDGSALTGVTASGSGIVVQHDGSAVGTAGTVNFSTNLDVTAVSAGIVTITASGGTTLTSDAQFNTVGGTNAGDSFSGTSANSNTLFGYDAGTNITTADRNTFIGFEAGKAVTAGVTENVFIGYKAGLAAQTSQQNVSVGSYTLQNMNHSSHKGSTAIGHYSLYTQTSGKDNCGLGRFSGYNVTEGEENVFLGSFAGKDNITTGSNNIIIGYNATGSSATVSNEITLGNSSITKLRLPGIGHTFTGSGAFISGIVTATTFSGSGASLTSLDAGNLGVGTIPNGRFPATLPAVSGANLTSLTAGNISGTLATGQIADEAITFAKMQHVATGVLIGRNDSGTGDIETLSASDVRTLLNVADGATAGITTASTNVVVTWDVVNNSGSSYRFTGPGNDGVEDNPDIYLMRGQKYRFAVNANTHPFYIKTVAGTGTGNQYTDGVTGNGAETGNVEFNVQHDAPASLFYQCSSHSGMVGNIYIVGQHLANGANNRVLTATSSYGINAESNMTFDGDDLTISHSGLAVNIFESTDNHSRFRIKSGNSSLGQLEFADQSDADAGEIRYDHSNEKMTFHVGNNFKTVGINSSGDIEVTGIVTATSFKSTGQSHLSGNLGIGTVVSTPATTLHLDSGGTPTTIQIDSDTECSIDFNDHGGSAKRYKIGTNITSNDGQFEIKDMTESLERFRITSDGRTFINTTAVTNTNDQLTVKRPASSFGEMSMTVDANTTTGTHANAFIFTKSKNTYWNGLGFQSSHGHIGAIVGMRDSTGMNASHKMRIEIGGTGINASEEKTWDFLNTGNLSISDGDLVVASGHGIDFSATADGHGTPSELLDDYEEGSFTATLGGSGWSYTYQYGFYRKIGTIVHVSIWIQASGGPNNSSSLLINLPFTTYSNSGYRGGITASFNSADFDNGFTEGRNRSHIDANVSYMQASFPFNDNGNWSSTGLTNAGVYDGFSVQASGTYISDS